MNRKSQITVFKFCFAVAGLSPDPFNHYKDRLPNLASLLSVSKSYICRFSFFAWFINVMDTLTSSQSISSKAHMFWGWIFLIFGSLSFVAFVYAAIVSKFLPQSENRIISAIQNDRYYCFLVPLTLPILMVAVYFHWLSMKLFKHA